MVTGIDRFRAHFTGHEHQYVLIGGAACELLMGEVGLDFRATKKAFVDLATAEADCDPRQFKVNMTRQDVADRLRAAYGL